jgi:hypothetical protein
MFRSVVPSGSEMLASLAGPAWKSSSTAPVANENLRVVAIPAPCPFASALVMRSPPPDGFIVGGPTACRKSGTSHPAPSWKFLKMSLNSSVSALATLRIHAGKTQGGKRNRTRQRKGRPAP